MAMYNTVHDAVIAMHERGFTNDFHLCGNQLFWVQEKKLIHAGDFCVLEYYRFLRNCRAKSSIFVLGIIASSYNAGGILITHGSSLNRKPPFVLTKNSNDEASIIDVFK